MASTLDKARGIDTGFSLGVGNCMNHKLGKIDWLECINSDGDFSTPFVPIHTLLLITERQNDFMGGW
jgi:hypothetical protein